MKPPFRALKTMNKKKRHTAYTIVSSINVWISMDIKEEGNKERERKKKKIRQKNKKNKKKNGMRSREMRARVRARACVCGAE